VSLVEFGDFRCAYCRRMLPVLARVRAEYPDQVRLVFMHFPVTAPDSGRAAIAAVAAQEQGRFWEMHDALFALQDQPLTKPALLADAQRLGLDVERFEADLRREELVERVRSDLAQGERLGLAGTPAFFVNGRPLLGAQSYEALAQAIETELAAQPD